MALKKALLFVAISTLALFPAACTFYKPLRTLVPETFGLTCVADELCLEDATTIAEASRLRDDALQFIEANLGPLSHPPRILFCSSTECFSRFGNPAVAALYMWGLDTLVVNESGWHDYILRHEMIHHWQVEHFGALGGRKLPRWYIEGMAYALSEDPRDPLPRNDIQAWRAQFNSWTGEGNDWRHPPQN